MNGGGILSIDGLRDMYEIYTSDEAVVKKYIDEGRYSAEQVEVINRIMEVCLTDYFGIDTKHFIANRYTYAAAYKERNLAEYIGLSSYKTRIGRDIRKLESELGKEFVKDILMLNRNLDIYKSRLSMIIRNEARKKDIWVADIKKELFMVQGEAKGKLSERDREQVVMLVELLTTEGFRGYIRQLSYEQIEYMNKLILGIEEGSEIIGKLVGYE